MSVLFDVGSMCVLYDAESCVCRFLLEMSEEIIGAAEERSFCLAEGQSDGGEDEREHSERQPDV